jgi:hypothetical protein
MPDPGLGVCSTAKPAESFAASPVQLDATLAAIPRQGIDPDQFTLTDGCSATGGFPLTGGSHRTSVKGHSARVLPSRRVI